MSLFRAFIIVAAAGFLGLPGGLQAQENGAAEGAAPSRRDRARAAFREGEQAYYAGRFAEALDRFSLAYELSARAELLYNIGTAHDRLGHNQAALRAYQEYLDARPQAPNREFVLARIGVLNAASAEGGDAAPASEPGEAPDASEGPEGSESLGSREGGSGDRDAGNRDAGESAAEPAGSPSEEAEPTLSPEEDDSGGPNMAGIAFLGTAGAAGIAAVVTGVMALGQRSDLDEQCPDGTCAAALQTDLDRLDRLTVSTDVLIGVAAVAATVGVVLLVTSGNEDEAGVSAACGLGHCEARVRW